MIGIVAECCDTLDGSIALTFIKLSLPDIVEPDQSVSQSVSQFSLSAHITRFGVSSTTLFENTNQQPITIVSGACTRLLYSALLTW